VSRKTWAIVVFGMTTALFLAGPVLVVLAGEPVGVNELILPAVYAFGVVGLLIALHRSGNTIAWICLSVALGFGLESALWGVYFYGISHPGTVARPEAWAVVGNSFTMPALFLTTTLLLLVFPSGHLPSPRWRWFARITSGLLVVALITGFFLPGATGWGRPTVENPFAVEAVEDVDLVILLLFPAVIISVVSLIRRFRRATGIERLQLRWLAAASAAAVIVWAVAIVVVDGVLGGDAAAAALTGFGLALIPIAIGVAVLRYRLFEIDRLISRTISYALVVGALAAVFAAVAIGLPRLVDVPEENPVLVAGATLAVAGLFNPLRRRVQRGVDRRFNRARYDSQREVDRFAERLRDELQIEDLTDEMLEVVDKTMQPSGVSVWIRGE
jgi:hypothetical protein